MHKPLKQFEIYNARYAKLERTDQHESLDDQAAAKQIEGWTFMVESWIQHDVQYAVYTAPDHEEWQKFRVSLKGQSTRMKLLRLRRYWDEARAKGGKVQLRLEKCRVDNYLGALVRGGQLSTSYVVQR